MKIHYLIALAALVAVACSSSEKDKPNTAMPDKPLHDLLDNYYEERLKLFPLEATMAGDNRYNDLLPNDISEAFRRDLKTFYQRYSDSLAAYDKATLTPQQQVSVDILERELDMGIRGLAFNDHWMPVQQFWSLTLTMPTIGSGQSFQPFKNAKDYDDFLKRIDAFSVWVDTAIVNMRHGVAAGITLPRVLMERVLPQTADMIVADATKSIFWTPITNLPADISPADKTRLTDAYRQAINTKIIPAYRKLHDFLRDEYIPKARTTAGISAVPGGAERYQYLINQWTTTDLTPDEIFNTGQQQVAFIRNEMEKVKEQVGFKGDLKAFFAYVSSDKKFKPFKTPEQIIEGYNAIHKRMQPQLSKLFNMVPKARFEVRQTEAFRAASASAEYSQGTPDGSRPGVFYVPILDATQYNVTGMETLFLHEAIPGHHYQISLQMENQELPKFRRFLWYGAYGEGWALYTEALGKELGLYTDPYQYFGHLGDGIHRAIRLVVDVGLHAKGWTREQAIQYMMDNEPIDEQGATAEIERYMAIPAQALSYKIGQLKIMELRQTAEAALGDKFDLAFFHDEVLKYGCVPLDVLERLVDQWIAAQKST